VVTALTLSAPRISLADTTTTSPSSSNASSSKSNFCTRIGTYDAQYDQKISDKQAKYQQRQDGILKKVEDKKAIQDHNRAQKRSAWDANRVAQFEKLMGQATTDTQKQAVTVFEDAVKTAIDEHRSALDAALTTFRTQAQLAIGARYGSIGSTLGVFASSTDQALQKAKADCAAGTDPKAVRDSVTAAIKASHDLFKNSANTIPAVSPELKKLTEERKAAVKAANDAFEKKVADAKATLKLSFK